MKSKNITKLKKKLPWCDPLSFAFNFSSNLSPKNNNNSSNWVFLYSALTGNKTKAHSYLAFYPLQQVAVNNFIDLANTIRVQDKDWYGFIGYEIANDLELLPINPPSYIDLPKSVLINFAVILDFNHYNKEIVISYYQEEQLDFVFDVIKNSNKLHQLISANNMNNPINTKINHQHSSFSDDEYIAAINDIKEKIVAGDLFQTNLTRKFFGEFNSEIDLKLAFQMFCKLIKLNPVNYSSFFSVDNKFIISASPELFLKLKNKRLFSQPIKGTAGRGKNLQEDRKIKSELKNSSKEKAENLMIVDLMRNDFSRVCIPGTVKVNDLFKLTTYQSLHHLSSQISGKLQENHDSIDVLSACFPPGSMTGAPKIKAIEVAASHEKIARGVYSGCIGYFSGKREMNLAVVIRTLMISSKKFEYQAGGAITSSSSPKTESKEVFIKLKNINNLIGLN